MTTTSHRLFKNSAYGIIGFIWPLLLSFVSIPLLIKSLGISQYGFYVLLNISVSFFSLLDMGFNYSFSKKLSENFENPENIEELNNLFGSTYLIYFIVGLTALLIMLLSSTVIARIFNITNNNYNLSLIFLILGLTFFFKMLNVTMIQVPHSIQKTDIVIKFGLISNTLVQILIIFLAMNGYKVLSLLVVQLISSIVVYVSYHIFAVNALPYLRLRFRMSFDVVKNVIRDGMLVTLNNVMGVIIQQLDKLVLGFLSGPSAVTFYSSAQMIPEKIQGISHVFSQLYFSIFSNLEKESPKKISDIFRRSAQIIILVSAILTLLVFIYGYKLIYYWLGADFADKIYFSLHLLSLTYFFISIGLFTHFFFTGTKRLKINAFYGFVVAILDIILMFILIPKYNFNGAAIAYLASSLAMVLPLIHIEIRILHSKKRDFFFSYFRLLTRIVLIGLIIYFVSRELFIPLSSNLFLTVMFGMISFLLYALSYYVFGFFRNEDINLFKNFFVFYLNKLKNA